MTLFRFGRRETTCICKELFQLGLETTTTWLKDKLRASSPHNKRKCRYIKPLAKATIRRTTATCLTDIPRRYLIYITDIPRRYLIYIPATGWRRVNLKRSKSERGQHKPERERKGGAAWNLFLKCVCNLNIFLLLTACIVMHAWNHDGSVSSIMHRRRSTS